MKTLTTAALAAKEIRKDWANMENFTGEGWCESVNCHGSEFIYRFFVDKNLA